MRGINKAIILGSLGGDPEMRYLPSGNAVTTISVATNESWTDKNTGQPQERTEWHRIEAFGKLAEIMSQYLRKGSQVYIEGSIRTDKWEDQKTGEMRYSTKIRAEQMQMLGGGQGNQGANNQTGNNYQKGGTNSQSYSNASGGNNSYQRNQNQGNNQGQTKYQPPQKPFVPNINEDNAGGMTDDDIPFAPYLKNMLS